MASLSVSFPLCAYYALTASTERDPCRDWDADHCPQQWADTQPCDPNGARFDIKAQRFISVVGVKLRAVGLLDNFWVGGSGLCSSPGWGAVSVGKHGLKWEALSTLQVHLTEIWEPALQESSAAQSLNVYLQASLNIVILLKRRGTPCKIYTDIHKAPCRQINGAFNTPLHVMLG